MFKFIKKRLTLPIAATILLLGACGNEEEGDTASTENVDFPNEEIEVIVPTAAGGGTDMVTRQLTDIAQNNLDQSIGVINVEGGSGSVGMSQAANAEPDGHTMSMVIAELAMYEHLGTSTLTPEEFKPVALVNYDPAALTVSADAPYDTLEEFIEYAEENPGEISVGNAGPGSIWHVAAVNLENATGIELNHVPHEGAAPAVTALVGEHIDAVTVSPAEVRNQLEAGNVKVLAVMDDERNDLIPDVPTLNEEGIEAQPIGTWRGLTVPSETPDEVVEILEEAFVSAAEDEEFINFMEQNGLGIQVMGSEEFGEFMDENRELFGDIIPEMDMD
ncbi:Bug family tripartite tricarboxylate transporter substrate binding protein [Salinicoccus roseus]|uniref:Bug family tripartite tricarboxylate transporter substrate binding protein n=1 Tax=Salinicoccus roseus TaxID=45670 RepID=UPI001EF6CC18|nr:tripartite tricarboxylate transporter substrate binding protein [Salinicoccus roseus]MCG7331897.1 tripartite tricarboxylate transporter substrate binding protein [Salinicoccus roseus]